MALLTGGGSGGGGGGGGRGRGGGDECVKACTGTKDHEGFLEIGLYGESERKREGPMSDEGDGSNEVDSLFSVFSASGGSIGRLSDRLAFFLVSPW